MTISFPDVKFQGVRYEAEDVQCSSATVQHKNLTTVGANLPS